MAFWNSLFGHNKKWVVRLQDGNQVRYLASGVGRGPVRDPNDAWVTEKHIHRQLVAFLQMDRQTFDDVMEIHGRGQSVLGPPPSVADVWMAFCRTTAKSLRGSNVFSDTLLRTAKVVPLDQAVKDHEAGKSKRESLAASVPTSPTQQAPELVRYRGLTFGIGGEYSLVWDDKKIVRGIWYRDGRGSIKNAARNRMVVAAATVNGFTVLESDYETTIVGGMGGVEDLQNPGGAVLWFDSTREIFGK